MDRSGFNEVSQTALNRLKAAKAAVDKHDFEAVPVMELDAYNHHLVAAVWGQFSSHCKEDNDLKVKRLKLTADEIEDQPQSKRRKVMYRVVVAADNDALKAHLEEEE